MTARLEPGRGSPGPLVSGFAGRRFKVDGTPRDGGVILTPEAAFDWMPPAIAALSAADLDRALTLDPPPEFVILGTGETLDRPLPALVAAIEARGIGVEAMDSRAAARAWAVLRAEGRWIAAALYPL